MNKLTNDKWIDKHTVHNIGEGNATNVTLSIYDGEPSVNGSLISSSSIDVNSNSSHTTSVNWTIPYSCNHTIFVVAYHSLDEVSSNNEANKTLEVGISYKTRISCITDKLEYGYGIESYATLYCSVYDYEWNKLSVDYVSANLFNSSGSIVSSFNLTENSTGYYLQEFEQPFIKDSFTLNISAIDSQYAGESTYLPYVISCGKGDWLCDGIINKTDYLEFEPRYGSECGETITRLLILKMTAIYSM